MRPRSQVRHRISAVAACRARSGAAASCEPPHYRSTQPCALPSHPAACVSNARHPLGVSLRSAVVTIRYHRAVFPPPAANDVHPRSTAGIGVTLAFQFGVVLLLATHSPSTFAFISQAQVSAFTGTRVALARRVVVQLTSSCSR